MGEYRMDTYNVGIYCRLSVKELESYSIENQRDTLLEFVTLQGWKFTKCYVDDGYSGGNFQRPAFLEMLNDAKNGNINLILTKDLSRIGRNFVDAGRYIDDIFPSIGCRFIALMDDIDSAGDNSSDMLYFRNLLNDYYIRDLSKKLRTSIHARKKSGLYLAAVAPYGYCKNPNNPNEVIIDKESSDVVKQIFELRKNGISANKIAALLNQEHIPSPRKYWNMHHRKEQSVNTSQYDKGFWAASVVRHMLKNTFYIGSETQNKYTSRSYKDKTLIRRPKEAWIIKENAHEPIISRELWDDVQSVNQAARLTMRKKQINKIPSLFVGKVVCADCGFHMVSGYWTSMRDGIYLQLPKPYICNKFLSSGSTLCTPHKISEKVLLKVVKDEIQQCARLVRLNEAKLAKKIKKKVSDKQHNLESIPKLVKELKQYEEQLIKCYEDKLNGVITTAMFEKLAQENQEKQRALSSHLNELREQKIRESQEQENINHWIQMIQKYSDVPEIDYNIVDELIEHIEVGEKFYIDGKCHQKIQIYYRYVGRINEIQI